MKRLALALAALCLIATGANSYWQSRLQVSVGSAPPAFSLTLTDSAPSNATGPSVNYGTLNYGSGNTRVIVAIQWTYNGTPQAITGVTVGGNALTQISGAFTPVGGSGGAPAIDVWMSAAPLAGSSGAVVVSISPDMPFSSSVGVYTLVTTTPTPVTPVTAIEPFGASVNGSITIPSGGGAIALTSSSNGISLSSFTNVTVDASPTPIGRIYYYGHTTATGAINPTATYSVADLLVLGLIAWNP